MDTPHRHADVIKAWADGAEIEFKEAVSNNAWRDCPYPIWDYKFDYRVKPSPKYVPFTWEDREFLRGKWIRNISYEIVIYSISRERVNDMTFSRLLSDYTFLDGSPCGKLE